MLINGVYIGPPVKAGRSVDSGGGVGGDCVGAADPAAARAAKARAMQPSIPPQPSDQPKEPSTTQLYYEWMDRGGSRWGGT
jgi:hypothetical protein